MGKTAEIILVVSRYPTSFKIKLGLLFLNFLGRPEVCRMKSFCGPSAFHDRQCRDRTGVLIGTDGFWPSMAQFVNVYIYI